MNKFILVLLIALVSCVKIEFDGDTLEKLRGIFTTMIKKIIKPLFKPIFNVLYKAGHIEELVDKIKKYGTTKAIELCTSWIANEKDCTSFVNELCGELNK